MDQLEMLRLLGVTAEAILHDREESLSEIPALLERYGALVLHRVAWSPVVEELIGGARALGLTPSAVSKLIGRLEERLATQLVHRSTRKLQLTAEGRQTSEAPQSPSLQQASMHFLSSGSQ